VLKEVWSVLRGAYPGAKAARLYGKALSLEKAGRCEEAFVVTTRALECLRPLSTLNSDPTVGQRLVITVLHAELAARLGTPSIAQEAIQTAIQAGRESEQNPQIREYIDWLKHRLETIVRGLE
jgi:hypothetical protein